MDLSIFLFRFFGFYFVIVGIAYMFRRQYFKEVYEDYFRSPALMAVGSILTLVMGLILVLNYTVWELSAKGFITFINYLILFKGITRLFFPYSEKNLGTKMITGNRPLIAGAICVLVGAWLLFNGYR